MEVSKAKFIVFEGIEACGKTTQVGLLQKNLERMGIKSVSTVEPTSSPIGKFIRHSLLSGIESVTTDALQMMFAADRMEHLKSKGGILDQLTAGNTVVCDRYYLSSIAYGFDPADPYISRQYPNILKMNESTMKILKPDITIFIDISPEEAARRLKVRGGAKEINDTMDRLKYVHDMYRFLLSQNMGEYIIKFDGTMDIVELSQAILKSVLAAGVGGVDR